MFGFLSRFGSKIVPIVRIHGSIDAKMTEQVAQQLKNIKGNTSALAVSINSPGGLPTQADIITTKLKIYAQEHKLPLLTFAQSVCASAGYYILCSGDQVYADSTSVVGSIGSIAMLFRFKEVLDHYNIEVRKFTSSEDLLLYNLNQLDNDKEKQERVFKPVIDRAHREFINYVVAQRGSKLKGDREKLFDGSVFLGEEAQKLGLVDAVGSMVQILNQKYPESRINIIATKKTRLATYTKYIMGSE